jgi:tRNA 5-methylaminomethyl-2-thiouridine biosynthesis bifunctional protein
LGDIADSQSQDASDEGGLFACLALGSRGMTWAALAAEIVASRICGEPMPVEGGLLSALSPSRFAERKRKGSEAQRS